MAKAKKLVEGAVYTLKFPSLKELLCHKDLVNYSKDEGEVGLKHQSIYHDHFGKVASFEFSDGEFYIDGDSRYSASVLKYAELVHAEIPFILKAKGLEEDIKLTPQLMTAGCSTLSKKDAVNLAKAIIKFYEKN